MTRTRARLEKLERAGKPSRVVVVEGHSDAEHATKVEALKASGSANERDLFVCIMRFAGPPEHDGPRYETV